MTKGPLQGYLIVVHSIPFPKWHPLACNGMWELSGLQEVSPRPLINFQEGQPEGLYLLSQCEVSYFFEVLPICP
jgi:hypothetical protein